MLAVQCRFQDELKYRRTGGGRRQGRRLEAPAATGREPLYPCQPIPPSVRCWSATAIRPQALPPASCGETLSNHSKSAFGLEEMTCFFGLSSDSCFQALACCCRRRDEGDKVGFPRLPCGRLPFGFRLLSRRGWRRPPISAGLRSDGGGLAAWSSIAACGGCPKVRRDNVVLGKAGIRCQALGWRLGCQRSSSVWSSATSTSILFCSLKLRDEALCFRRQLRPVVGQGADSGPTISATLLGLALSPALLCPLCPLLLSFGRGRSSGCIGVMTDTMIGGGTGPSSQTAAGGCRQSRHRGRFGRVCGGFRSCLLFQAG